MATRINRQSAKAQRDLFIATRPTFGRENCRRLATASRICNLLFLLLYDLNVKKKIAQTSHPN
jgi:hypothetical protein